MSRAVVFDEGDRNHVLSGVRWVRLERRRSWSAGIPRNPAPPFRGRCRFACSRRTAIGREEVGAVDVQRAAADAPRDAQRAIGIGRAHRAGQAVFRIVRSAEHTSELQSLMRISYAVLFLKKT